MKIFIWKPSLMLRILQVDKQPSYKWLMTTKIDYHYRPDAVLTKFIPYSVFYSTVHMTIQINICLQ